LSGLALLPFLYAGGAMVDLNTLVASPGDWQLISAQGINDRSEIVVYGALDGSSHAFLAVPVPEPDTLLLMLVGMCGLTGFVGWPRHPAPRIACTSRALQGGGKPSSLTGAGQVRSHKT
jgi:hypothetical protein